MLEYLRKASLHNAIYQAAFINSRPFVSSLL